VSATARSTAVAGHEFSAVGDFTYNFTNQASNYQNGVDFHLDMAAAQFLSKQVFFGAVSHIYNQLSADRGSAPILGPIESRAAGVGPQIGYIFPVAGMQGYLNHNRPRGGMADRRAGAERCSIPSHGRPVCQDRQGFAAVSFERGGVDAICAICRSSETAMAVGLRQVARRARSRT
jgi:hypothetical protein